MALSAPHSNYTNALVTGLKENWAVQLYYANSPAVTSTSFLGISFSDVTITHDAGGNALDPDWSFSGVITNKPTIRETYSIESSKVSTSNVRLDLANFTHSSNPVSEELFGGSNKYINHTVRIYSVLDSIVRLDQSLQIYEGKLEQVTHNLNKVSLQIVAHRPYTDITVPNVISARNNFFPVVYGDYTNETSTNSSPQLIESAVVHPLPVEKISLKEFVVLAPQNVTARTLHFHEGNADLFCPVDDTPSATTAYGDGYSLETDVDLHRSFHARPLSAINEEEYGDYDNVANMIDTDAATYGHLDEDALGNLAARTTTEGSTNQVTFTKDLHFELPQLDHEIQSLKHRYRISLNARTFIAEDGASTNATITLQDKSIETDTIVQFTHSSSTTSATNYDVTKTYTGQMPDKMKLSIVVTFNNGNGTGAGTVSLTDLDIRIYDVLYIVELKIPIEDTSKASSANQLLNSVPVLYSGADGFTQGWENGNTSTLVLEPQDIIRDMLDRYTGFDNTDSTSFSTATTNRDGWNMRLWQLEPTSLKGILDRVAYEGACPWHIRADGTLRYITIANDPSTANHTLDKNDFSSINISHTPVRQLKTSMKVFSELHPAKKRYITASSEINNSTPRTNWFEGSSFVNKSQVSLNYLVANIGAAYGGNKNDDFVDWYGHFFGDVKMMISINVVNPAFYYMEVGDIVAFTNGSMSPVKAFASAWTSLRFVITSISRSVGDIKVDLYEV